MANSPTPEDIRAEAKAVLTALTAHWDRLTPQVQDTVGQSLLMILGSGPALAAFDSMMAAQQANGLMYHNAVANQQKTNLLGMAMTAKCVRYMMEPNADQDGAHMPSDAKGG
jgi:hypothetical protein